MIQREDLRNGLKPKKLMFQAATLTAALLGLSNWTAFAQPLAEGVGTERQLDNAESCRLGRYMGEGNGLSAYVKSGFEWRVSPEFAKKYCYPETKIQKGMNGILAIGYRPNGNIADPVCQADGSVCHTLRVYQFDILLPEKSIKNDGDIKNYYSPPINPLRILESAHWIATSRILYLASTSPPPIGPVKVNMTIGRRQVAVATDNAYINLYDSQALTGVELLSIFIKPGLCAVHEQAGIAVNTLSFKTISATSRQEADSKQIKPEFLHISVPDAILKLVCELDKSMADGNQQAALAIVSSISKR